MKLPVDEIDIALFTAATTVTVHDGRKASFWLSSWIEGQSPASLFPQLYRHSRRKNRSVREAVLNGKWIDDVAFYLSVGLLREIFLLGQKIQSLQLDLTSEHEDQIVWTLESSGKYSARSAYEIQFSGHITSNFPKLIWKAWATPRCKFFIWLLLQNRVWTAARLQLWGWRKNYFCALCERNLETATHLFIEFWTLVAMWSDYNNLQPASWTEHGDMEEWFMAMTEGGTREAHSLAILTLWHIWKERNARVFHESPSMEQAVFTRIKDECSEWVSAGRRALSYPRIVLNNMSN